jgi:hypothetical protein
LLLLACGSRGAADGTTANQVAADVRRGRALLSVNDTRALQVLHSAAQRSLQTTSTSDAASSGATAVTFRQAREQAVDAHLWWGRAENRLGSATAPSLLGRRPFVSLTKAKVRRVRPT